MLLNWVRFWRRLLRVPWTARKSNQSILKEMSLEYSLEGLMLKPKLQYFGHLKRKRPFIGKDPDVGKDLIQEQKGMTEYEMVGWHHWLDGHEFEQVPGVGDGQGSLVCCSPCTKSQTQLSKWPELNWIPYVLKSVTLMISFLFLVIRSCLLL